VLSSSFWVFHENEQVRNDLQPGGKSPLEMCFQENPPWF
jgi:hypothetical protein